MSTLPNLLTNPSAAANTTGIVMSVSASGAVATTWNSGTGQDGTTGFARYTTTSATTAGVTYAWIANESAVSPTPGHVYLMTGWFRTSTGGQSWYPRSYFFPTTQASDLRGTPQTVAANTWTFFSITAVAPPTATNASLLVTTDASIPSGTTIDIDNMSVQDVTSYAVVNHYPNPSATTSIGTWIAEGTGGRVSRQTGLTGSPVPGITTFIRGSWSASPGVGAGGLYAPSTTAQGINAGASQQWTYGAWVRSNTNIGVALNLECYTSSAYNNQVGAVQQLVANQWTWLTQTFTTPTGTTAVAPYVNSAPTSTFVSGNTLDMLGVVMTPGSSVPNSFDGNTAADGLFTYTQQGTYGAQYSSAVKTYVPNADATIWLPGVSAWDWISPMVQAGNLKLYCDEQRNWYLVNTVTVAGVVSISSSTGLTDATDTIDLSNNSSYYTAVVCKYQAPANTTTGLTPAPVYDVAGVAGPTLVIDYDDTVYPGPGAAAAVLARLAGFGRAFAITSESQYGATPGQQLSISIPNGTIQSGSISSVTWRFPDGTMDVGSTGLLTIPSNAWILATDTWATSPTGSWATDT